MDLQVTCSFQKTAVTNILPLLNYNNYSLGLLVHRNSSKLLQTVLALLPKNSVSSFFKSTACASINIYMVNRIKVRNNLSFDILVLIDKFPNHCTMWMNKPLLKGTI